MFDKKYKNAMDGITPNEDVKSAILEKIELKTAAKKHKNPAAPWRVAFACVACAAVLLGVIFLPERNTKIEYDFVYETIEDSAVQDQNEPVSPQEQTAHNKLLSATKTYDEIYNLIKENDKVRYEEMESETVADDMAMPGATNSDNVTSAPTVDESVDSDSKGDYSNTTEQVEGVAEADIVKTDGKYIYYKIGETLSIYSADGENSVLISRTLLPNSATGEMFLMGDKIILMQPDCHTDDGTFVQILIYDLSDRANPKLLSSTRQQGWYNTSRMVGDYIYVVSNCDINSAAADLDDPCTFVPYTEINGVRTAVPADSIYYYEEENYQNQYTIIGAYNYKDGSLTDTASLLGGADNIYCSSGNIILADTQYTGKTDEGTHTYIREKTIVSKLSINEGNIEYKTSGEVYGTLNNQFFIDEYKGYFRFVTTATTMTKTVYKFENSDQEVVSHSSKTSARLTVLDSELKMVGEIVDLAEGERVYSVRFMGDIAYFVTFRQTDPLFSADLSDPANPKLLGELKIPGFSEYMYPYTDGLLLGFGMNADEDTGRADYLKLSMFNVTDPANVTEQDVTVLEGYTYSTALDNHKAMLVSPQKNLIGFVAHDNRGAQKYMIYEYTDTGFNQIAAIAPPFENTDQYWKYWDDVRGLFVGDNFYIVSSRGMQVLDINTFTQIAVANNGTTLL